MSDPTTTPDSPKPKRPRSDKQKANDERLRAHWRELRTKQNEAKEAPESSKPVGRNVAANEPKGATPKVSPKPESPPTPRSPTVREDVRQSPNRKNEPSRQKDRSNDSGASTPSKLGGPSHSAPSKPKRFVGMFSV